MKSKTLCFFCTAFMVAACHGNKITDPNPKSSNADWVIKTYATDARSAKVAVKTLGRLLATKPIKSHLERNGKDHEEIAHIIPGQGRAWLAANSIVALNASPAIHKGVPDLIQKIESTQNREETLITNEIWAFAALPGKGTGNVPSGLLDTFQRFQSLRQGHCLVEVDHLSLIHI